ncbi:M23 family metallopeptidase [Agaribacter marinus]|uniref:M23 family metallopeptidase n=1 Tax=Agaribacter marinus TaxID=1431249 RepID=UPI0024E05514|nr:M23 family metallopeptidase [Agaribacter marinus]
MLACGEQRIVEKPQLVLTDTEIEKFQHEETSRSIESEVLIPNNYQMKEVVVLPGDNISLILKPFGITGGAIYELQMLLQDKLDINKLKVGTKIEVQSFDEKFIVRLATEYGHLIEATWTRNAWKLNEITTEINYVKSKKEVLILDNIYQNSLDEGVPHSVVNDIILILSYLIDLQRDVKKHDSLIVEYEQAQSASNPRLFSHKSPNRKITYLQFNQDDKNYTLYRFEGAFYFRDGRALHGGLLKTPINGAKLTSHFGNRKHPILGYSRIHKGIDFSAPIGTSVLAAGDGKVIRASSYGTFGNCVIIEHKNGYRTLYAHLENYASNIRVNSKVKQGDVIGFLGNTGLSGGRHLHYEIHKNGRAIDPLNLKNVPQVRLEGNKLMAFNRKLTMEYNDNPSLIINESDVAE